MTSADELSGSERRPGPAAALASAPAAAAHEAVTRARADGSRWSGSGRDLDELMEAVAEAISLYLSEPGNEVHVELEDAPGSVTERHMLARTA
jgi:hypothetical protein